MLVLSLDTFALTMRTGGCPLQSLPPLGNGTGPAVAPAGRAAVPQSVFGFGAGPMADAPRIVSSSGAPSLPHFERIS